MQLSEMTIKIHIPLRRRTFEPIFIEIGKVIFGLGAPSTVVDQEGHLLLCPKVHPDLSTIPSLSAIIGHI